MHLTDRRTAIIEKIETRCDIVDTGYFIDGKPSPCHLWTGPTSGDGRGGGYGRMSLNNQTVAVHHSADPSWATYSNKQLAMENMPHYHQLKRRRF